MTIQDLLTAFNETNQAGAAHKIGQRLGLNPRDLSSEQLTRLESLAALVLHREDLRSFVLNG